MLFSTIWRHNKKVWHERTSYKILSLAASLAMFYGLGMSGVYMIGAIDKYEWQATQAENVAIQEVDKRKAIKLTKKTVNGYTQSQAMAIIKDQTSSDQQTEAALQSIKQHRQLQANRVSEKKSVEGTINEEKFFSFFSTIYNFSKKLQEKHSWKYDGKRDMGASRNEDGDVLEPKPLGFNGSGSGQTVIIPKHKSSASQKAPTKKLSKAEKKRIAFNKLVASYTRQFGTPKLITFSDSWRGELEISKHQKVRYVSWTNFEIKDSTWNSPRFCPPATSKYYGWTFKGSERLTISFKKTDGPGQAYVWVV